MISLADATSNVRLLAKILGGVIIVGIIGYLAYQGVLFVIRANTPPPPPEAGFGELPEITFPESGASATDFTYQVNTLDGNLPVLPDRLPVYTTQEASQSLIALQETRERMNRIGFSSGETRLDRNVYQWTRESGEIIQFDILNKNFDMYSAYIFNPPSGVFSSGEEGTIVGQVFDFLPQLGIDISNLQSGDAAALHYFLIQNDTLQPSEKIQGSQIARVDLFQVPLSTQSFSFRGESVSELPIVYPRAGHSTMNFLLEPSRGAGRIVEAHFKYFPIDRGNSSDYPLISVDEAWSMLEEGDAYIAKYDPNAPEVDITDVQLGYFVGESDTGYVLPVVRFLGENFEAYVDVVDRTPDPTESEGE